MLTTITQIPASAHPKNPIGVCETIPITIATHPSHFGKGP